MQNPLELKLQAFINEDTENILRLKLEHYDLGSEFNYAVIMLDLSIAQNEKYLISSIYNVKLTPIVRNVVPFVDADLATSYCDELVSINKVSLLLNVVNGKIIVTNPIELITSKVQETQSVMQSPMKR